MSAAKLLAPPVATCVCGHEAAAHRHYRPGTDCGLCGCDRLLRARPRLRDRLRRRLNGSFTERSPLLLLAAVLGALVAAWITTVGAR